MGRSPERSFELNGLAPSKGVRGVGGSEYLAEGADPQMLWRPSSEMRPLLTGRSAVRVRVRMEALDGRLTSPCIYVDWGDGFSEESRKPLTLVEPGLYSGVAHTNAGACRRIRFDPSSTPCRFALTAFEVEPTAAPSAHVPRLGVGRRLLRRVVRRLPVGVQNALQRARRGPGQGRKPGLTGILRAIRPGSGDPWRATYVRSFEVARNLRSPEFAAPPLDPPRRAADDPAVVAFYLPQFHPVPENDRWWGKGFTEWTNVSKAVPQFLGHWQPRLPAELGYYDLRVAEVRRAQADLARRSGVDVFCFHYYWFAGRRLLEAPLDGFAEDAEIDLPFALCWANENWTRRWDGLEGEVLMAQAHSPEDDLAAFDDMARYMRSPRYFRVGARPLLVVYRPDILPEAAATLARWRARARETGLGELYLVCTDAFGFAEYREHGFDGVAEFPPHAISLGEITHEVQLLNPAFSGRVYDYEAVVGAKVEELSERGDARRFPGVMPAWDNEARKPGAGHVFHNASPELFRRWTTAALACSRRLAPPGERLVFVNAWNEWAEGAYLEPDRWFGHGFAQAIRASLEAGAPRLAADHPIIVQSHRPPANPAVALLHVYYPELIEELAAAVAELGACDVAVTFPDVWSEAELERLARALPSARLQPVENRGRDIAPFMTALRWAHDARYEVFCKLHSKRSPHMAEGESWRRRLLSSLTGTEAARRALDTFAGDPQIGMLAPSSSQMRLGDPGVLHNNAAAVERLSRTLGFRFDAQTPFAAGSMFWGRTKAFERLISPAAQVLQFEPEMGRIDGTLAHAVERSAAAIVVAAGYRVEFCL